MNKLALLRIYLYIFGILAIIVIPLGAVVLGDTILWTPRNIPTEMMMNSIFVAMGIVMILSARNPLVHKAFVDFIILSNIIHAIIMLIFAQTALHLLVDVTIVGTMGGLPLLFYPWGLNNFLKLRNDKTAI